MECGEDIVNSVTIHRLYDGQADRKHEDVVLVTNNDKTVRIFSLSQMKNLTTIRFDVAMNHASMSPTGDLMIAVGDEPRVFFCKRSGVSTNESDREGPVFRDDWAVIAEPEMSLAHQNHIMPGDCTVQLHERVDTCFATAFSPSGHLCAAASQTGIITVFDTRLIYPNMGELDAVVDIFRSSRPVALTNFSGAIRSMCFSPAPWDLLAWAEDRERVCIVDVRSGPSRSKQTLYLDPQSPDLNLMTSSEVIDDELTSEERQLEIEARFIMRQREALDAQDRLAAVSHATEYMELSAERRRLLQETRIDSPRPSDENFHAFTEAEERMLEEIRQYRLREGSQTQVNHSESDTGPYSVRYPESSGRSRNTATREQDRVPELRFRSSVHSVGTSLNSISRSTDSIRDWIYHRSNQEQGRSGSRREPRRRSSVVMSNSNDPSRTTSSHPSSLAPIGTTANNLSASPSRLAAYTPPSPPPEPTVSESQPEAWSIISNAMTTTDQLSHDNASRNPLRDSSSSTADPVPPSYADGSSFSRLPSPPTSTSANLNRWSPNFEQHLAHLRANADNLATQSATDRQLAALRAQQDRSLQQLRDQQAQLATYQARYERLRSVNAADMRRLEQTYLERSSSGRGTSEILDDEQLALVHRIADPNFPNIRSRSELYRGIAANGRFTRRVNVHDLRGEENDGPVTMGLSWSIDGRALYVGTEEGIFGYNVNMLGRMQFPAVEWL